MQLQNKRTLKLTLLPQAADKGSALNISFPWPPLQAAAPSSTFLLKTLV
jgi:hypothetical protein